MMSDSYTVAEKKNIKLWQLMRDSKSFFNIKEMDKLACKSGIRSILVKNSIKWLLDENMISQEKLGSINVYWTLPSEDYSMHERKRERLNDMLGIESHKLLALRQSNCETIERIEDLLYKNDENTPKKKRKAKIQNKSEHNKIEDELEKIKFELKKYENIQNKLKIIKESDVDTLEKEIKLACDAIQRWNDNILSIKQWIVKNVI